MQTVENLSSSRNDGNTLVGSRFLSELSDIKPCPFCGKQHPFGYYNAFTAYLGCDNCGVKFGSVRVLYKKDELPEELKGLERPADALIIRQEDGTELPFPEHGYYSINCVIAFDHAGILLKWNRRP